MPNLAIYVAQLPDPVINGTGEKRRGAMQRRGEEVGGGGCLGQRKISTWGNGCRKR